VVLIADRSYSQMVLMAKLYCICKLVDYYLLITYDYYEEELGFFTNNFFFSELMSLITKESNQALFCHHV